MTLISRCPSYAISTCPKKTDPQDSCCLIPDCTSIPTPIPSPQPGQATINPTNTPQSVTGSFTGVVPYQPGQNIVGTMCKFKQILHSTLSYMHIHLQKVNFENIVAKRKIYIDCLLNNVSFFCNVFNHY